MLPLIIAEQNCLHFEHIVNFNLKFTKAVPPNPRRFWKIRRQIHRWRPPRMRDLSTFSSDWAEVFEASPWSVTRPHHYPHHFSLYFRVFALASAEPFRVFYSSESAASPRFPFLTHFATQISQARSTWVAHTRERIAITAHKTHHFVSNGGGPHRLLVYRKWPRTGPYETHTLALERTDDHHVSRYIHTAELLARDTKSYVGVYTVYTTHHYLLPLSTTLCVRDKHTQSNGELTARLAGWPTLQR